MNAKLLDLDKIQVQKKLIIQATVRQINEVEKMVPSLANIGSIKLMTQDIYELMPKHSTYETPQLLSHMTIGELSGKTTRNELIIDFENSSEFYEKAKNKNSFKIIADEFSAVRNSRLYEGFNLIEHKWRKIVVMSFGLSVVENAPNPENYQSKSYDHKISQYVLSEFFENFLYQPASDIYIRKRWKESTKTEDEVVRLTKLRRLDELGFPLNSNDLNLLQSTRNKCMHFRVITAQEYSQTIDKINHYLKIEAQKEFLKTFSDSIKPLIDSQNALFQSILASIKPGQELIQNLNKQLGKAFSFADLFTPKKRN